MESDGQYGGGTGKRRPGMKEVAERAGVAMSSVSRVLSGHPDVSEPMRRESWRRWRSSAIPPTCWPRGFGAGLHIPSVSSSPTSRTLSLQGRSGRGAAVAQRRILAVAHRLGGQPRPRCHTDPVAPAAEGRRASLSLADEEDAEAAAAVRSVDVPVVLVDRDLPAGMMRHGHSSITARACGRRESTSSSSAIATSP